MTAYVLTLYQPKHGHTLRRVVEGNSEQDVLDFAKSVEREGFKLRRMEPVAPPAPRPNRRWIGTLPQCKAA